MPKPVAWSYSRLKDFELCPKKYYHKYVAKDVKDDGGEAMQYGSTVHKQLEARIGAGRKLSPGFEFLEKYARRFDNLDGEVLVEQQMAINDDFEPCDWRDWNRAYCRAIADVLVVYPTKGLGVDWKTGRMLDDRDQMDILAYVVFQHYPDMEELTLCYGWLKEGNISPLKYDRQKAAERWSDIIPRVRKLETATRTTEFPARPNGTCSRFCPVRSCPHNGT